MGRFACPSITRYRLLVAITAMNSTPEETNANQPHRLAKRIGWLALLLALVAAVLFGWLTERASKARRSNRQAVQALTPGQEKTKGYVSSESCRACHPSEYESWHQTYHQSMTKLALPGNVAGKFDGSTIISDGLEYRVFRKGPEYWAEMPDPEIMMKAVMGGIKVDDHTYRIKRTKDSPLEDLDLRTLPRVEKRVVMTTGSHHYQTYWVEGGVQNKKTNQNEAKYGNLLQTLPLIYLFKDKRWIPREDAFMMAPSSKRMISQWNHHCIKCHSVAGNPGILDGEKGFNTRVAEFSVSCEACHGPAGEHIRKHQNPLSRYQQYQSKQKDPTIVNPENLDHRRSSQVCGQCHGIHIYSSEKEGMSFAKNGPLYRPGDDIHKVRYYIQHPYSFEGEVQSRELRLNPQFFRERWWDDGTILAGGREFTAIRASKCYTHGEMSCLSCHTMHHSNPQRHISPEQRHKQHTDQLKPGMSGNQTCIQCHDAPLYTTELEQHTFHELESSGSNCQNCHMPYTSYGLLGAIRSHQIQSPAASRSIQHGTPNACNLCHLDKTLGWTQQHLVKRYDQEPLPLSAEQEHTSAALLWLLKGHAVQRIITAWHAGWQPARDASGTDWLAPHLARLLQDPYGVVRYVAKESLGKQPGFDAAEFDYLATALERERLAKRAIDKWNDLPSDPDATTGDAILINSDRQLMETAIQALLKQRDNRPFTIKE